MARTLKMASVIRLLVVLLTLVTYCPYSGYAQSTDHPSQLVGIWLNSRRDIVMGLSWSQIELKDDGSYTRTSGLNSKVLVGITGKWKVVGDRIHMTLDVTVPQSNIVQPGHEDILTLM